MDKRIFSKAAEIIKARGWTKGTYYGKDGSCCLMGACYAAMKELNIAWLINTGGSISDYVAKRINNPSPTQWNDAQTNVEPVLEVLDRLANE